MLRRYGTSSSSIQSHPARLAHATAVSPMRGTNRYTNTTRTDICVNVPASVIFISPNPVSYTHLAQAYGAHDAESVGGTVHTSVALALAAGLGLTAVGVAAAPWALSAMGTPADIMDFALIYLRVYMLGTIPSFLYNVGSGILRAVGDTRRPLYFLIIACLRCV